MDFQNQINFFRKNNYSLKNDENTVF